MESYFRSGLAPSTKRSYTSVKRRFLSFCDASNSTPLPVTEHLLCRYVSFLAEQGLSPKSVKLYLSAVHHLQISLNFKDPKIGEMPKLEQVMRGVKREQAKCSPGKRTRLPITPEILLKLRGVWEASSKQHNSIMLWAACCLLLWFPQSRGDNSTIRIGIRPRRTPQFLRCSCGLHI